MTSVLVMVGGLVAGAVAGHALARTVPVGVASTTLSLAAACEGAWPMYQHDPNHSADGSSCSAVDMTTVSALHPKWFVPTAGQVSATPSVLDGTVYVGDGKGVVYAIDQASGGIRWTFDVTSPYSCANGASGKDAHHGTAYGKITSTAAVSGSAMYVGGGGTLFALSTDPSAPQRCLWAHDLDPRNPTSPMEVESSPVIDPGTNAVIVGSDVNEAGGSGVGRPGVQAFDAATGLFRWKFQPEDLANPTDLNSSNSDGCGSVWGSPALDTTSLAAGSDGLVFFGTGNCDHPDRQTGGELKWEGAWAIDATTGHLVWNLQEPPNAYNNQSNSSRADDDIGSSPIVAHPDPSRDLAIFASKTGYAYGLDEATGAKMWQIQAAQPGNLGQGVAAFGGFIGSGALGMSNGTPAVFLTSAIFTPFSSDGIQPQVPPLSPDASIVNDPLRLASLHAISALDGTELWHAALSTPTYAAATYANGVVFAPSTTGFAAEAFSADTGAQIWRFPTAAPESSGVSMAGSDVFFGSGTDVAAPTVGVWALTTRPPALR